MTAGTVLVNGPTDNSNGALDDVGGFQITSGVLVAVGTVSGEGVDGLYPDGVLTGATAQASFTIEGILTGGGMSGGPGGGMPGGR